jgi:hypothetical protein
VVEPLFRQLGLEYGTEFLGKGAFELTVWVGRVLFSMSRRARRLERAPGTSVRMSRLAGRLAENVISSTGVRSGWFAWVSNTLA